MNTHTIDPGLAPIRLIRQRNREARGHAAAVHNVMDRLEVYGVVAVMGLDVSRAVCRDHATRIVDAVLALTHDTRRTS